jgi:hypothetical protein
MATLAPYLPVGGDEDGNEQEQLLKLFWNRAELKKELNQLREESRSLHESFKQQETETLRIQQRLVQLEAALGDPERAMTAVAYYRLRAVWDYCHARLESLCKELARAQHDKAQRAYTAGFKRKIDSALVGVESELQAITAQAEELTVKIVALTEQRIGRKGLWNIFRRRKLSNEIDQREQERNALRARIGELMERLQVGKAVQAPEFCGLDVATRRIINLTVIAFAQELYLHFSDRKLAGQLKDASVQKLTDAAYGSPRDCLALCKYADDRARLLQADNKLRERVQFRAEQLREVVGYRQDGDTVPDAMTLGLIPLFKTNGRQRGELELNVLGEEYWDIFATLLD